MAKIQSPFPLFVDVDGDPLESGFIYIGQAGLNPEVSPISVYSDKNLTVPVAQPIRTLGGLPVSSGTPVQLYTPSNDFSITVRNKNGSLIRSALNASTELFIAATLEFATAADMVSGTPNRGDASGIDPAQIIGQTVTVVRKTSSSKADGAQYVVWSLDDYRVEVGDGGWVPNSDTSYYFFDNDHVAILVQGKQETVAGKMERLGTQKAVDKSEIIGALSTLMASINRRKPRVSGTINEKIQRAMATDHHDFVRAADVGGSNNGIVFGQHVDYDDVDINPMFCFMVPIDNTSGTFELSITIESVDGSDLNDLTVYRHIWESYEDGADRLSGSGTAMTKAGSTWTQTAVLSGGVSIGNMIGISVLGLATGGSYEITNFSITNNAGRVYKLTKSIKRDIFVTLACEQDKRSVRIQELNDSVNFGAEIRSCGVLSGRVPSKVFATPEATSATGDTGTRYSGTIMSGFEPDEGLNPTFATRMALSYMKNGYRIPAVMFMAGTYAASTHVDLAVAPTVKTEWLFACPNGVATLTESVSGGIGLRLRSGDGSVWARGYVANIHCDDTLTIPFTFERFHIEALNIKSENATAEGCETDYSDFACEDGDFSGSGNDGVNSHESGHITLIDTNCYNNSDDGFSPHDACTYEVHGGEYHTNGKGNIIPAFGAKGFCVGVTSYDSTGLSPRAATLVGRNDGGFVCLSDNTEDPTTMFLVECSSTSDTNGIVSAGRYCFTLAYDTGVSSSTVNYQLSNTWETATNSGGDGGLLFTTYMDTAGDTIEDEDNRILNLNGELLRRP